MPNVKRRKLEEEKLTWSNLCWDVLQMVLERLSDTDFDRAKAVCSTWRSASKETLRKQNQTPWLILFPYERSNGYACGMSNPVDTLVYKTRNLGVEFTQSRCIATCGSWLLMYVPHRPKLYILNPLTRHRITLPPLESRKYHPEEDAGPWRFNIPSVRETALKGDIRDLSSLTETAVFWFDHTTKDYMVMWSYGYRVLFFSRRGDQFWNMFPYSETDWQHLVYKDHMLYILTRLHCIEIFDLSGDSILAVPPRSYHYRYACCLPGYATLKIAVTPSGEVLMVKCGVLMIKCYNNYSFDVYKMNHATKEWDVIASLGDHALILDLGITLPAEDVPGLKTDSIYFSGLGSGTKQILTFNLATREVEPFVTSTRKFFDARWFLPSF